MKRRLKILSKLAVFYSQSIILSIAIGTISGGLAALIIGFPLKESIIISICSVFSLYVFQFIIGCLNTLLATLIVRASNEIKNKEIDRKIFEYTQNKD
jgi:hypothetical protein